jgi:hypothetical protein
MVPALAIKPRNYSFDLLTYKLNIPGVKKCELSVYDCMKNQ